MAKKLNGLKIHDSAFKFMVELDPQHLLDRFAIPYTFREFLPTENVLSIDSRYSMDCLILTKEGVILNLEFQSTYPKKDKRKVLLIYAILTTAKYEKQTSTYVITILPVKSETHCNKLQSNIYHRVYQKSSLELNGKELLNNINNKIKDNKPLTKKDKQDLILIPYSTQDTEETARLILQSMKTTNKIKANSKEEKMEKGQIKYLLMRLCEKLVKDNEKCKEIRRLAKMGNPIFEEWKQEGIEEGIEVGMEVGIKKGKEEGMEKGMEDLADNLKKLGVDNKILKKALKLTQQQNNTI